MGAWRDGQRRLDRGDRVHDLYEATLPQIAAHGGLVHLQDRLAPGVPQGITRRRQLHQGRGRQAYRAVHLQATVWAVRRLQEPEPLVARTCVEGGAGCERKMSGDGSVWARTMR